MVFLIFSWSMIIILYLNFLWIKGWTTRQIKCSSNKTMSACSKCHRTQELLSLHQCSRSLWRSFSNRWRLVEHQTICRKNSNMVAKSITAYPCNSSKTPWTNIKTWCLDRFKEDSNRCHKSVTRGKMSSIKNIKPRDAVTLRPMETVYLVINAISHMEMLNSGSLKIHWHQSRWISPWNLFSGRIATKTAVPTEAVEEEVDKGAVHQVNNPWGVETIEVVWIITMDKGPIRDNSIINPVEDTKTVNKTQEVVSSKTMEVWLLTILVGCNKIVIWWEETLCKRHRWALLTSRKTTRPNYADIGKRVSISFQNFTDTFFTNL